MVLVDNAQFHAANKYVASFLASVNADQALIDAWKEKANINRLKTALKKTTADARPKRVVSKYLYFCHDERSKIFEENPGMNIKDVTCELGKRWQAFQANPEPERMEKITRLFEEDKKRYDESKPADKPKKRVTKTAYQLFCDAERARTPGVDMKELGIRWHLFKEQQQQQLIIQQ
jgi:hypothetical protein